MGKANDEAPYYLTLSIFQSCLSPAGPIHRSILLSSALILLERDTKFHTNMKQRLQLIIMEVVIIKGGELRKPSGSYSI